MRKIITILATLGFCTYAQASCPDISGKYMCVEGLESIEEVEEIESDDYEDGIEVKQRKDGNKEYIQLSEIDEEVDDYTDLEVGVKKEIRGDIEDSISMHISSLATCSEDQVHVELLMTSVDKETGEGESEKAEMHYSNYKDGLLVKMKSWEKEWSSENNEESTPWEDADEDDLIFCKKIL
ncbi:MAG: hypothetical protein HOO06_06155 [Bdellovibrionaceae bacterium]|jgi:hypothetical protein|nr:hypothetical protein [Pseudobdellovibrionaceae bacterium]